MKIKKHKDDPNLSGEHPQGDFGQMLFLTVFVIVWILDSFVLKYTVFLSDYIPLYIRIILSAVTFIIFFSLMRQGLRTVFKEKRDKPVVIREGIFKFIRHPIYTASVLFYLVFIFLTFSIISIIVWIIIIAFFYYIARYEEKILLEEFGSEYERYMKEVPMFIPFSKKRKN